MSIGGGGGGGPVGTSNSFTGAAQALEVIGDHAYAFSGQQQIDTSAITHLEFTTGNYYFVGRLNVFSPSKEGQFSITNEAIFSMEYNGSELFSFVGPTATNGNLPADISLIIPPYTEVKITAESSDTTAGETTSCNLVGRIHRTRV